MTELDIKDLLHRARRPWRFGRYKRDVIAVCEQALVLLEVESKLAKELHMSQLTIDEFRRLHEADKKQQDTAKEGIQVLMETIRRLKGGRDDNGREIPILNFRR